MTLEGYIDGARQELRQFCHTGVPGGLPAQRVYSLVGEFSAMTGVLHSALTQAEAILRDGRASFTHREDRGGDPELPLEQAEQQLRAAAALQWQVIEALNAAQSSLSTLVGAPATPVADTTGTAGLMLVQLDSDGGGNPVWGYVEIDPEDSDS